MNEFKTNISIFFINTILFEITKFTLFVILLKFIKIDIFIYATNFQKIVLFHVKRRHKSHSLTTIVLSTIFEKFEFATRSKLFEFRFFFKSI